MNEEIWKPIKEYENLYEISNYGRVRSFEKKFIIMQVKINYKQKKGKY